MPNGKPAGVRCTQLDDGNRCMIFGRPERPAVCAGLRASVEMCGLDSEADAHAQAHAMHWLTRLEAETSPT